MSDVNPPPPPVPNYPLPPRGFWKSGQRTIWATCFFVTFLGLAVTLFTAPTFQEFTVVTPPPLVDQDVERSHLASIGMAGIVTAQAAEARIPVDPGDRFAVRPHPAASGGGLELVAEGDNPERMALLWQIWADVYTGEATA